MDTIQMKAFGKVNLGLDVLRRREDGYHEVRMVMRKKASGRYLAGNQSAFSSSE